ncbi:hypothetical protein OAL71_02755, partial [Phycisphaerales bacterium]|nr:hypothetical protein [Phycisphaerales bacterium]
MPAPQDSLQIKKIVAASPDTSPIEFGLLFKNAKQPIGVSIPLGGTGGAPRLPKGAIDLVIGAAKANPKRLIAIKFEGAPLRFAEFPREAKLRLLERGGPEIAAKYDRFVSQEIGRLIKEVRIVRPRMPISVQGLPFEDRGGDAAIANKRFGTVIAKLSAFVLERGVVLSSRSDERQVVSRVYPNALALSEGRAIIYPMNLGWRMAIEGQAFASATTGSNVAEGRLVDDGTTSRSSLSASDSSANAVAMADLSTIDDLVSSRSGVSGAG